MIAKKLETKSTEVQTQNSQTELKQNILKNTIIHKNTQTPIVPPCADLWPHLQKHKNIVT